ncbi:MAG: hypothetical protein ACQERC_10160 [Bacteroidota bacterium]
MDKVKIEQEIKTKIREAYSSLKNLEIEKSKANGSMQREIEKKMKELESKKNEMDSFYEEILNSTDEHAREIRKEVNERLGHFQSAMEDIKAKIST